MSAIWKHIVRLDGSKPIQYGMKLDVELTVDHIKKQLSILSSLSMEQIAFFDVTVPSCLRRYTAMDNNHAKIKQLNIRDFIAYELPLMKLTDGNHFPSTYIIAVHRRLERQERYLSPLTREKMIFFGHPIIIPYNNCSSLKITNQYIYENIFKQLERLLRKNTDMTLISNHALDCDDSLGERYPFILKHVNEDGKRCSICPWNRFCFGCSFQSNNNEFLQTSGRIAIEWESSTYYLRYLSSRERDIEIDSSVKLSSRIWNNNNDSKKVDESSSIIKLEDCLESFINWENLDNKETFNCKRCQQSQPADKKLDIWKLPPCLIFHIKRFQLSNNRWIKSSRLIRFPIRSFYPSKYLPQCSPTTSHSLSNFNIENNPNTSSSSLTTTSDIISSHSADNSLSLSLSCSSNGNNSYSQQRDTSIDLLSSRLSKQDKTEFQGRQKTLENQNDKLYIPRPPKFSQSNDRMLSLDDKNMDIDNVAYNLYAFICHYGVIGGGHYVAFVKNHTNQQWYCFNDSSCKLISQSILEQCLLSAYLLFYERECLDHRHYMPNIEGKNQVANELSLPNDDRWCSLM